MIPKSFEYLRPKNISETLSLLSSNKDSKILAGGQSLLPLVKLRLAAPRYLIDIGKISGLAYISEKPKGTLTIGALTTHDMVANSHIVKEKCYVLAEATSHIGDQQIRNRGTSGGSLCHADPAAELPVVAQALDAEMIVAGSRGQRTIRAHDFFVDYFTTSLDETEILMETRYPVLPAGTHSAYVKLARRESDFPICSAAAVVAVDSKNICQKIAVALGAVGPTPIRALAVEESLIGKKLEAAAIDRASAYAEQGTNPTSDMHGSGEYRKAMARIMTKKAIMTALGRK